MNGDVHGLTVGVLTPHLGGYYHGAILAGIHRAAAARRASVVAIQTSGTDLYWDDEPDGMPLGLCALDGFIVVHEIGLPRVVTAIEASGKPLACIGSMPDYPSCCAVLPDNAAGTRVAVRHLISHGHRRIGFAGNLGHPDVQERYGGCIAALQEANITESDQLVFACNGNLELDGREVGRQLIAMGLPCTALVAGTDKNALGILFELRQAGYRVPADLAVVGFDDIEHAQYADPPLATVRQRIDLLGEKAAEVVLARLIDGIAVPHSVRAPTLFLARRSCGCFLANSRPRPASAITVPEHAVALREALREAASSRHMTEVSPSMWPGAALIVELLVAISDGRPFGSYDLGTIWQGFLQFNRDVESIDWVMGLLDDAARNWPVDAIRQNEMQSVVRQLRIELMREWRAQEQAKNAYYDLFVEANARINVTLSGTEFARVQDLSWLRWTRLRYGNLSLWQQSVDGGRRRLQTVSEYQPASSRASLVDIGCLPECFPPEELQNEVDGFKGNDLLMIVPVPGANGNHGLLTVAGPMEVELRDHVGNVCDWGALIGSALERSQTEERLKRAVLRDALTGLPNRVLLLERMQQAMANARRTSNRRFAVLILDLDGFKNINDGIGHFAGDRLLIEIAHRLERAIREADTIARLGGDEFAIVAYDITSEADVVAVVERVQTALRQPVILNGDPVVVSASIGVALSSEHYALPAAMLRDADIALCRAKRSGRARYLIFNAGMHQEAVARLRLESQLQQAIERDEFVLHFQPIVSLSTETVIGAEALIRWQHPEHGCLSPLRFLSTAEEAGLAIPLSKWVINAACREVSQWRLPGLAPLRVNVNVPAEHLAQPDFFDFIRSTLQRYGISSDCLGVELVESSLIENRALTIHVLEQLREIGVSTYIDDFGTGYSSLSYLQCLPVSGLKIDRGFISDVDIQPHHAAIVTAIITMARSLGLSVVAEGVERLSQLEFLRSEGCDVAQGFLFSQPVPSAQWQLFCATYPEGSGVVSTTRDTYGAISESRLAI